MLTENRPYLSSALLLLALFVGCDRHIESRDPVRSLPDAPPTPAGLAVTVNNQSVDLAWTIAQPSSVNRYRVYQSQDSGSGFLLVDSTTAQVITLAGLALNQVYYFRVAAVNALGVEGQRSAAVPARTGVLSIAIANHAEYTNNRTVSLQLLSIPGTSYVTLSEDAAFTDSVILAFSSQVTYTLSQGDGTKRVYARFSFADGSHSGTPVSDEIILDTRATIDSVYFEPTGRVFSPQDEITFFLRAADAETDGRAWVSFADVSNFRLSDDGVDADALAGDGIYSGRFVVPNTVNAEDEPVTGAFIDAAGNQATPRTATDRVTILSSPAPQPVVLAGSTQSDTTVYLSWSRFSGQEFANYILYRDTDTATPDSLDLSTAQSLIVLNSISDDDFTDYRPDPGTFFYQVYVYDAHGRSAGSNVIRITK
jgi:hypothetical protein